MTSDTSGWTRPSDRARTTLLSTDPLLKPFPAPPANRLHCDARLRCNAKKCWGLAKKRLSCVDTPGGVTPGTAPTSWLIPLRLQSRNTPIVACIIRPATLGRSPSCSPPNTSTQGNGAAWSYRVPGASPTAPTTQKPSSWSSRSARERLTTWATGTDATAPAAARATAGVSPAARSLGTTTPAAPAPSTARSTAPRLWGSCTQSRATIRGSRRGLARPRHDVIQIRVGPACHLQGDALVVPALGQLVEPAPVDLFDRQSPRARGRDDVGGRLAPLGEEQFEAGVGRRLQVVGDRPAAVDPVAHPHRRAARAEEISEEMAAAAARGSAASRIGRPTTR